MTICLNEFNMPIVQQIDEVQGITDTKVSKILSQMRTIINDLTNRSGSKITPLTGTADIGGVVNKVNEIISTIQGTPSTPAVAGAKTTTTNSMIRLNTANGYGSTNNKIPRFSSVVVNTGTDITYTDSATLGASFVINTDGNYAISLACTPSAAGILNVGISLNTTAPTTLIYNIPITEILNSSAGPSGSTAGISWVGYLVAGSVIRPHLDGQALSAGVNIITVSKVS